jgi:hypothetical protein
MCYDMISYDMIYFCVLRKTIDEAGFEEVKVQFYRLMVQYHSHEVDCWEICQCFFKVRQTDLLA